MTNISKTKWGVDTNILIYLYDKQSPFHLVTVQALQNLESEDALLFLCQQNIIEFVQILTKWYNLDLSQASKEAQLLPQVFQVISPQPQTHLNYLNICSKTNTSSKNHFDLFLASTLLDSNVSNLLTNNPKDFQKIPNLSAITPAQLLQH